MGRAGERDRVAAIVFIFALTLAPGAAGAQTAAIDGAVTDATGFALPGVTVEARPAAGGEVRTAVTGAAGRFAIDALPPGPYDVTFTLPGFRTVVRNGVATGAGAAVTLEVEMAMQLEARVVVVGSRARPRSVTESTVPIDAIPYEDIASQGDTDVGDQLRTIVPSYNVNPQPVGDAARLIRPASLRGLAPDHTLVLVNGKRRHRGAVITWIGNGVADGAQGPDISSIPSIALRRVEVLRDGAAAQYGSDAIAGVLNFLLKDDRSGGSLELHTGGYGAGDGGTYTVAGNAGLPLGETGFANLSVEYGNTGRTSRSVQRDDAAALIAAGNDAVADPAQIWGSPRITDNLKLWGNVGHLFAGGVQAYGYANYARRTVTSGFFFRNPNTRSAVFSADGGQSLLIGDVLDAQDGVADGSASRVAMLRGGDPLEPERSVSHAVGAVIDAGPFRLTADYFRIRLSDRLALTRLFALSPAEVDGRTTFGFLFNYTGTTVTRFDSEVLDATRIRELQEAIPGTRWNATVRQVFGRWSLLGRLSHYGEWFDSRDLYVYHGDAVVDLEAAYPVSESTTLTIGGRNVLGNDPEENPIARATGNRYSAHTPFGINGRFYYLRLNYGWRSGG